MITLTPNALTELRRQAANHPGAPLCVRLEVKPGGCSGTTYVLDFPGTAEAEDVICTQDEFTIRVGRASREVLSGLEVDFLDSLVGGGFRFRNPNAASSCGCGASFRPVELS